VGWSADTDAAYAQEEEPTMQPDNLWMDLLFGNWIGLLSLGVIAFVVVMAVWIFAWFIPHQMDKR
jgi:hypothetical protein